MAKLDITLSKEAFDKLGEELKGFYVPTEDGKSYELEGIGSIQRALAEEKAKKTTKPELLTEVETLRKFKEDAEAKDAEAANKGLEEKGKYDEALAAKELAWQKRIDDLTTEKTTILSNLKAERIKTLCTDKGILPERVRSAIAEGDLENLFELESGESGFTLKKKGGIGDVAEMDSIFTDLEKKAAWVFKPTNALGSGAPKSNGEGAGATDLNTMDPVQMLNIANAAAAAKTN